ncbi:MAG: YqeG family HAD IIIA-type phosphatase [Oscillospiraceae bacterium]|nr:YqeG family HAD IIIA-type phosphatase [Oscillospiraceae bacterium]MCL2278806.1 YqeG family HAD IIIA-type phosphatase [Oscillospiraceae bacterium]
MSKGKICFIAKHSFRDISDIEPQFLIEQGVSFLMLDLDNTIAAYNEHSPAESVKEWFASLRKSDIKPFIISNSTRTKRVESFAEALDCEFIMRAAKPSPKALKRAMAESGFTSEQSALVGDQTFTDVLAARLAGTTPILVRPRAFTNLFLALRYYIEVPIRLMCRDKH